MNYYILKALIIVILFSASAYSQWPGYFYTFELKDAEGKSIDTTRREYTGEAIICSGCEENIVVGIRICADNRTWRFYAGGNYSHLKNSNFLRIDRMVDGKVNETMTIEFPATLSGGQNKFYRNLYAGIITFKEGNHKINLPETDNDWDNLKEINLCPDKINNNYSFFDISIFQK